MGKRRRRHRHDGGQIPAPRGGGQDFGRAARTMLDPRAPRGEHHDAAAEVYTQAAGEVTERLTAGDLEELRHESFALLNDPTVMAKAVRLETGWTQAKMSHGRRGEHTAILHINEFGVVDSPDAKSRWFEKRSLTGFELLRDMSNIDLLAAIDLTFLRQALRFFRPERDEIPQGIRIARVDGEAITEGEKPEVQRLERMLFNGGDVDDYFQRRQLQRSRLDAFATKYLRDSLAADACPIELTRTNGGKLSGWHNLDYTTFRLCSEYGYEGRDEIGAVQLQDGVPQLAFAQRDFLYEVRNPRSELYAGGYGFAEAEMLLRVVTGYLHTVTYNLAGLDRSALPRGILTLIGKGIFNAENKVEEMARRMQAMLTGPANRHRLVSVAAEDGPGAVWTPIDQFDDMYFMRLAIFLVAIACAVKGCDPAAISFDSFSSRTASLSGSDTGEKLSFSRNKGLLPVLDFAERIPSILVGLANPKYRVQLVGVHEEDEARKHELIKLSSTWNEMRALRGADPHADKVLGEAPAGNPQMMNLYLQRTLGTGLGAGDELEDADRGRGGANEDEDQEAPPPRRRAGRDADAIAKAAVVIIHRGHGHDSEA